MFVGPELNLLMIQWWKRFLPVHFSACVHTSQGEKFLIIGLPRVHLLLLNGNVSQGCVWDSSNRRKYYRFNKVLMGAVTRDTFTVVNDPLIRLDKKLSPTGFSRQDFYSLSRRENKHPSNFERSVFGPPLAENRPTPALRICRWLPIFANWKKKENRFLGATKHLFFLACCQIFAFYHFKGFFPFLLRQQPLTEPKLVPAFLFFYAAKALPLSPAVVVSPTACSSGLDLGSGYCAIFMISFLERILCTTERVSYFSTRKRQRLSNSLSISSISLRPFLSFSRHSLMNSFIMSSQNTFARHPEAPRITTARSLVEIVESCHCASILGISTSSYEGLSTPMALFFRHIQTMRSVGGRNSAGSGASGCIWHGLGLGARIVSFVQQQSLEKTTSSPCTSKISVTKIGQRRNLKTAAIHSVAPFQFASLFAPSLVGLATIPCTLPLYFA